MFHVPMSACLWSSSNTILCQEAAHLAVTAVVLTIEKRTSGVCRECVCIGGGGGGGEVRGAHFTTCHE